MIRIATAWLDGCSGCHMSLLDLDERLLDLVGAADLVYSPLVDAREFPQEVDVALIEGAVSSEADADKIRLIRERSRVLVSFGDCAVTSNVPALRNEFAVAEVMDRAYVENTSRPGRLPGGSLPRLLPQVRPLHEYVPVDIFLPGCPPPADLIHYLLTELLQGRVPDMTGRSRFGA
jgi:NAD-reducing hydrogenase small subunit